MEPASNILIGTVGPGLFSVSFTLTKFHLNCNVIFAYPIPIAWNIYQFTFISVLVTTTTFAAEVRPKDPGPALVVVAASKNFISFGLQYAMVPLVDAEGYLWAMGILTIIFTISFAIGIPVYFFNPWWRKRTSGDDGLGHIMNEQDLH